MKSLIILFTLAIVGCKGQEAVKSELPLNAKLSCDMTVALPTPHISSVGKEMQVFGDSNARGESSCDPLETTGVTTGFAFPLAVKLDMTIENKAIGGSEITSQLQQINLYGQRHTDLKILMAGHNDAYFKTNMNMFKSSLTQAIQIMAQNANLVVIGTTTKYSPISGMGPSNPLTLDYRNAVIEVVNNLALPNVMMIDTYSVFNPDPSKFVPDTVHFNKNGSEEISELYKNEIINH